MLTVCSTDLLREAVDLYFASQVAQRDVYLRVGRLLHEYVLAALTEGANLPEAKRPTRERLVAVAADRLNCTVNRANDLIHVGQVAELLLDPGDDLKGLSWSCLRAFRRFVARVRLSRHEVSRTPGDCKKAPQERERWEAAGNREHARRLILRCAREGCNAAQCATRAGNRQRGPSALDLDLDEDAGKIRGVTQESARVASPRDLADLLAQAILESCDPKMVLTHLLGNSGVKKLVDGRPV